jgi:type IV pilus assembly protein PilA
MRLVRARDDEGFSLVELMVVVLVIAILIAVAVPAYVAERAKAQDLSMRSDVRNYITLVLDCHNDTQDWSACVTQAQLGASSFGITDVFSNYNGANYQMVSNQTPIGNRFWVNINPANGKVSSRQCDHNFGTGSLPNGACPASGTW